MDFMTNTLKLVMVLLLLVGCQEQSKEVLVQDGMEMVTQGNPLGAIVLFSSALDKDANYITARHQLGLAYHKSGKLEKAEREFQKVRLQSPDNGVVLLDIASLYLDMRKIDDAEVEIRQFLKKHSKNTRSQEYLGRILNVRGDLNGAELLFDEAIELDEKNIDARLALAQFHMKQGRSSDARVLLIKATEDFPKIKDSYYMLAALEMHAGHNLEALRAYRQVVIIDASDVGALYMASILALNIGNSVDAQQGVDDMSKRFPGHPLTSRLMGMVAYTDGDFENATVKLRLSLREIPDLISYYFLGLAEYKLGHFELALNQFRNALDIHSGHHQSRLMIGLTFLRQ
ncbi:MAG: tetratricopeptide repeat protein, partial [Deltaproteobacteria bacterium]|nr:tetratricopeptide repeat protein [Deltaproteobacteria bacterium]